MGRIIGIWCRRHRRGWCSIGDWWCPSSKVQLGELMSAHQRIAEVGLKVFAGSVDSPAKSAPMQEYVGDSITILAGPGGVSRPGRVQDSRGGALV